MRFPSKSDTRAEACGCTSAMHAQRRQAFAAAREQWPAVALRFEQFCAHLNQLGYTHDLPVHAPSLYLCVACGLGDPRACKLLETNYFPALRTCVTRLDARAHVVDEVLQQVRDRLLVGPAPRIARYHGRGSLSGWLRAVAQNTARDFSRAERSSREQGPRGLDTEAPAPSVALMVPPSAEEEAFRARYAPIVQRALSKSVLALGTEERTLLHHYFVSGLGIDALGQLYAVDRSTAARRISRNVRRIQRGLRQELIPVLGPIDAAELERWVPVLYQRFDMTAETLLAPD
jgi:RNA polymerase sigma-70 factor, ECF subfamily